MATLLFLLVTVALTVEATYTPDLGLSSDQLDLTPRDYKIEHVDFTPKEYKGNKDASGGKSANTKGYLPPATSYQSFWMESKNAVPVKVANTGKNDLEYPKTPLYLPPDDDHSSQLSGDSANFGQHDSQSQTAVGHHSQQAQQGYDHGSTAGPSVSFSGGSSPEGSHTQAYFGGQSGESGYQSQGGDEHQSHGTGAPNGGYAAYGPPPSTAGTSAEDSPGVVYSPAKAPSGFSYASGSEEGPQDDGIINYVPAPPQAPAPFSKQNYQEPQVYVQPSSHQQESFGSHNNGGQQIYVTPSSSAQDYQAPSQHTQASYRGENDAGQAYEAPNTHTQASFGRGNDASQAYEAPQAHTQASFGGQNDGGANSYEAPPSHSQESFGGNNYNAPSPAHAPFRGNSNGGGRSYLPPPSQNQPSFGDQNGGNNYQSYTQSKTNSDDSFQSYGPPPHDSAPRGFQSSYQNEGRQSSQGPSQVGYHSSGLSFGPPPQRFSSGHSGPNPKQYPSGPSGPQSQQYPSGPSGSPSQQYSSGPSHSSPLGGMPFGYHR